VEAAGLGGPELRAAGLRAVADTESVAVMGFADVLTHLPEIRRARQRLLELLRNRPDALFLPIDAPGLNLALARAAKRSGRRVVYYVAPQVWAWGEGRVRRLRSDVDLLLLLFRFEEEPLRRAGVRVAWVGHPAGALRRDEPSRRAARAALGVEEDEMLLALLPGSRRGEAGRHLAPMLDAAARLVNQLPGRLRVAVSDAGPVGPLRHDRAIAEAWDRVRPIHHAGEAASLLRAADAAAVASGTATLEAAALGTPLVIVYRTGRLNYEIARRIVRVPRIGLPNLVLGRSVAPELIQDRATGHEIARALAPLLTESDARESQRRAFAGLPDLLGGPGSGERAADALLTFVRAASPTPAAST
jgi:lipid-A-disaccharide synthase